MKTVSDSFKKYIQEYGRQLSVRLTLSDGTILTNDNISSFDFDTQGSICSSVERTINISLYGQYPQIKKQEVQVELGVYLKDTEVFEYVNLGTFYVYDSEYSYRTKITKLTCYDLMIYSHVTIEDMSTIITYTTPKDLLTAIAKKCGYTFTQTGYINENINLITDITTIKLNSLESPTYRDLLDYIAQITCSTIVVNDKELKLLYPTATGDTLQDGVNQSECTIGDKVGPLNKLTFSGSYEVTTTDPESGDTSTETVDYSYVKEDSESEAKSGIVSLAFEGNPYIHYDGSTDTEMLNNIFTQLDGLTYYVLNMSTFGFLQYEIMDRINVKYADDLTYDCVIMNHSISMNGGITEKYSVDQPSESTSTGSTSSSGDYNVSSYTEKQLNILNDNYKSLTLETADIRQAYVSKLNADNIIADRIESGELTTKVLKADYAHLTEGVIDNAKIDQANVNNLEANYAHIKDGVIDNATIGYADVNDLDAHYAEIDFANIKDLTAEQLKAATANIDTLISNTIDTGTLTTKQLQADYATIGLANVNNAWLENGVIKNAAISNEMINDVSANKLTAGTIDASKITVNNLNASNITVGKLTVGGLTIDVEESKTELDGDSIKDGTITLAGLSQEVKDEIDGAIETFTSDTIPTLNNYPAVDWTTEALKKKHIGDICYVTNSASEQSGYSYRFSYDSTSKTYSWVLIKDTDVTKALEEVRTLDGTVKDFKTEYNTYTTKTDAGIETLKTRTTTIETTYATKDYTNSTIDDAIDDIQVGGRNLINVTGNGYSSKSDNVEFKPSGETNGKSGYLITLPHSSDDNSDFITNYSGANLFSPDSFYTISFMAWSENETDKIYFDVFSSRTATLKVGEITNSPTIYTLTGKLNEHLTTVDNVALIFRNDKENSSNTIYVTDIKLEEGTKATTWVQAQEDLDYELKNLQDDLQEQIDAKIETYYQETDPSLLWTTEDLKKQHVGDLWCYTGATNDDKTRVNNSTYKYNNLYNWEVYSANTDLFDKIDGKCTIYYGDPNDESLIAKAQKYDYLVDDTDSGNGDTYEFNGTKWVKVTDLSTVRSDVDTIKDETIPTLEGEISTKVETTTFNKLVDEVDEQSSTITKLSDTVKTKADSSTVETLSTTVNQVKQTTEENTASISNLTTTVGNNKTEIEARASTIEQNLDGFKTTVSKTYQTKDDMNNYSTTTQMYSAINQSATEISSTVKSYTDTAVNDVQVGGRNLINTISPGYSDSTSSKSVKYNTYEDEDTKYGKADYYFTIPHSSSSDTDLVTNFSDKSLFTPDSFYTISFKAWATKSTDKLYFDVYSKGLTLDDFEVANITDEVTGYSVTGKLNKDQSTIDENVALIFRNSSTNSSGTIYITDIQLEEGTKATDWTTSEENVQHTMSGMQSEITQNAESIVLKVSGTGENQKLAMVKLSGEAEEGTDITIQANNINIKGAVTFTSFSSDLQEDYNTKVTQDDIDSSISGLIEKVVIEYAVGDSATDKPTEGWSTDSPKWEAGKYIWQRTTQTTEDGKTSSSQVTCIQGAKGESGSGVTIKGQEVKYQSSTSGTVIPTGTWEKDVPTVEEDNYLWTRTIVTYSDDTSTTSYSVAHAGKNGKIYYTWIKYADTPTSGMSDNPDGKEYMGIASNKESSTESTDYSDYNWSLIKGSDGTSEYVFIKYGDSLTPETMYDEPTNHIYMGVYSGTSSTAPTSYKSYKWSKFVGDKGNDGNGINSISYYYMTTTTQTAPDKDSSSWGSKMPTIDETNKYLWQKEVIDFTDTSVSDKITVILIAVYGDKGTIVTVGSTEIKYQASSDGKNIPTGEWSESIPTVDNGSYLWTRTIIKYTDSSSSDPAYSVAYKGTNGTNGEDGNGIDNIKYYYKATTTSDTPDAGDVTSEKMPTLDDTNKYLWQKEIITFTDKTTQTTVLLLAVYGDKGTGIKSVQAVYYVSTTDTVPTIDTSTEIHSDLDYDQWCYQCIEYKDGVTAYYTSTRVNYDDGTFNYRAVSRNDALLSSNKNSFVANSNSVIAVETANDANTTATNTHTDLVNNYYDKNASDTNLDTAISDIQVGGRNLVNTKIDATTGKPYSYLYDDTKYTSSGDTHGKSGYLIELTHDVNENHDFITNYSDSHLFKSDSFYTISFVAWSTLATDTLYVDVYADGLTSLDSVPITNSYEVHQLTGKLNEGQTSVSDNVALIFRNALGQKSNNDSSIYITDIKIEEGTKATTWTQSVEDVDAKFSSLSALIVGLQDQIDGEIDTWYYPGEPTLDNEPAVNWKTESDKLKHTGDIYYDTDTEYCYRYNYVSDTKSASWVQISDEGITKAMQIAKEAKQVADTKATIYYGKPEEGTEIQDGDMYVELSGTNTYIYTNGKWQSIYDNAINTLIEKVDVQYALSDSPDKEPDEKDWSTKSPEWESGKYVWQRTVKYTKGSTEPIPSAAVCIQGAKGESGSSVYNILLTNENQTIVATSDGKAVATTMTTDVLGYLGTTSQTVTVGTITGCPDGMSSEVTNNGTAKPTVTFTVTTKMDTKSGTITIPVTIGDSVINKTFSYSLSIAGSSGGKGADAKLLTINSNSQVFNGKYENGSLVYSPTSITLSIDLQGGVTYSGWQYSIDNGSNWSNVVSGQSGLTINSDNSLTISRSCTIYTDTIYSIIFRCNSSDTTVYDTMTIIRVDDGDNGKSIGTITNWYLATELSSGVDYDTKGWTTTVQSTSVDKKYLWNYEVVYYSDNTEANKTKPCIIGTYGTTGDKGDKGVGISDIIEYYAKSSSNSSTPTSWDTKVPTITVTERYLWNYETISYTDGSSKDSTARVIGVYGDTGNKGKGYKELIELYYITKETSTYTDPSTSTIYTGSGYDNWYTECASYVEGVTKFYTCTKEIFDDNTVDFTSVLSNDALLSSNQNSFEANNNSTIAMDAANDASTTATNTHTDLVNNYYDKNTSNTNLDTAISDIQIGGRNLIQNGYSNKSSNVTYEEGYEENGKSGYLITLPSNTYYITKEASSKLFKSNSFYTISFMAWSSATSDTLYFDVYDPDSTTLESVEITNIATTYKITGMLNEGGEALNKTVALIFRNNNSNTIKLTDIKIEEGTKATTWVQSEEDLNDELNSLEEDLTKQIDAKIETYYQSTDPSSDWKDEDTKKKHVGDLWCYTGDTTSDKSRIKNATYRYNSSYSWESYSATKELFDDIDGKSTIYYGTTTQYLDEANKDDYLVDSTNNNTYKFDGSKWVQVTDISSISSSLNTVIQTTIPDLQKQIDGAIDTWYYSGVPSSDKEPEKSWTDEETKLKHVGDLYYDKDDGLCYRYIQDSTTKVFSWIIVDDEKVSDALKLAKNAQETADGKATIYYGKPTTTVQEGDMYTDGTNTYVYHNSTWVIASDYTTAIKKLVKSADVEYALGDNQTTAPTSGWQTKAPEWQSDKYMWQRTLITYQDGSTNIDTLVPTCIQGAKGDSGASYYTYIRYSANSSGSGMVETPTSDTKYIGTYSGTSSTCPDYTSFKWSQYAGTDGNGISKIEYYYATSTTQSQPSESSITSTSIPKLTATNKYLWQKEVITYTKESSKTTVLLLGVYGDTGVGITSIDELYFVAVDKTPTTPTSISSVKIYDAWSTQCADYKDGVTNFYTCSKITYDDTSVEYTTITENGAYLSSNQNSFDASEKATAVQGDLATNYSTTSDTNSNINSAVSNIRIGGENLINTTGDGYDTKNSKGSITYTTNGVTVGKSGYLFTLTHDSSSDVDLVTNECNKLLFSQGNTYTISFRAWSSVVKTVKNDSGYTINGWVLYDKATDLYRRFNEITGEYEYAYGSDTIYVGVYGSSSLSAITITNKTSIVYTITGDLESLDANLQLIFRSSSTTTHGDIYITDIKMEEGTKATDWTESAEDLNETFVGLQDQIDGKIETYYQDNNPNTWEASERDAHNGDLWYCTATTGEYTQNATYRYNSDTNSWEECTASKEVFDKIDGKTTVYYGTTSSVTTADVGDYLVDDTTGNTYRYDGSKWIITSNLSSVKTNSITEQTTLYILASSEPDKPEKEVTSESTGTDVWTTVTPTPTNGYTYYTCTQSCNGDGTYSWTEPQLVNDSNLIVSWCSSEDKTYINGGKLYAKSVEASALKANSLTISDNLDTTSQNTINNKARIFYGETSGTYDDVKAGDYLVAGNGDTYKWVELEKGDNSFSSEYKTLGASQSAVYNFILRLPKDKCTYDHSVTTGSGEGGAKKSGDEVINVYDDYTTVQTTVVETSGTGSYTVKVVWTFNISEDCGCWELVTDLGGVKSDLENGTTNYTHIDGGVITTGKIKSYNYSGDGELIIDHSDYQVLQVEQSLYYGHYIGNLSKYALDKYSWQDYAGKKINMSITYKTYNGDEAASTSTYVIGLCTGTTYAEYVNFIPLITLSHSAAYNDIITVSEDVTLPDSIPEDITNSLYVTLGIDSDSTKQIYVQNVCVICYENVHDDLDFTAEGTVFNLNDSYISSKYFLLSDNGANLRGTINSKLGSIGSFSFDNYGLHGNFGNDIMIGIREGTTTTPPGGLGFFIDDGDLIYSRLTLGSASFAQAGVMGTATYTTDIGTYSSSNATINHYDSNKVVRWTEYTYDRILVYSAYGYSDDTSFAITNMDGDLSLRSDVGVLNLIGNAVNIKNNNSYLLTFQNDNNFVMYNAASVAIWSTGTQSDRNKKKNIIYISENVEKAYLEFKPRQYQFNEDVNNQDIIHYGFIAQEVEEALENNDIDTSKYSEAGVRRLISYQQDEDGTRHDYQMDYTEIIALNTHMIQKLYKENEELESQVQSLQSENKELKSKLSSLEERLAKIEELLNKE